MKFVNPVRYFAILIAFICVSNLSIAQTKSIDDLFNKTWYILAMKCPGGIQTGSGIQKDIYMQYYFSIELKPEMYNSYTYGTYTKIMNDESPNPETHGDYKFEKVENGLPTITLIPKDGGEKQVFSVKLLDGNHLTLVRISESDNSRCRVHYAFAP